MARRAGKGKSNAATELAARLLDQLEALRGEGPDHYPPTLEELRCSIVPRPTEAEILKAASTRAVFEKRAILAKRKAGKVAPETAMQAPVALLEDANRLAASSRTLEFALRFKRSRSVRALTVSKLGAWLTTRLQGPFKQVWNKRVEAGDLPFGVAWIQDGQRKLFLWEDLQPPSLGRRLLALAEQDGRPAEQAAASPVGSPSAPDQGEQREPSAFAEPKEDLGPFAAVAAAADPRDFAARFEEAFLQIDRQKGSHNFVSLVDLRRALSEWPRPEFDRGLRALRLAGRYSLSAAESIFGIRPEDRQAGIEESGVLLLHVSRKSP